MKNVFVVVYKTGMLALPYFFTSLKDANRSMELISIDNNMKVRELEMKCLPK